MGSAEVGVGALRSSRRHAIVGLFLLGEKSVEQFSIKNKEKE